MNDRPVKYNKYMECVTEMAIDIGMLFCDDEYSEVLKDIDQRELQIKIVEEWADEFLKIYEDYEWIFDYVDKVWEFTKEKALEYSRERYA